ncbi:MAG: hypothetical protein OEY01_01105 [Desulfobulbaceae bacterium]|nr:hypothetical protein [Desulfobulbaceae bacterium]HIJ77890.1 hypothetical protein [Deltaproteobacteria bacterium]
MLKHKMQVMPLRRVFVAVVWLVGLLLVIPSPIWAVQSHGGAEGLVSHQIGHILFVVAMITILVRIRHHNLVEPGWKEFKIFLWLLLGWNLQTFVGHLLREFVVDHKFVKVDGNVSGYHLANTFDLFFYLTRLDHLLLVPAFLFLLLALRRWEANK